LGKGEKVEDILASMSEVRKGGREGGREGGVVEMMVF
jgi:hypothetical protein